MTIEKIFLDANILFSVAYGSPGLNQLWELFEKRICVLIASKYVIEEAKRNLRNPEQLNHLEKMLENVQTVPEVDQTIECPIELPDKDKPVLLSAISAKADYLITGDITHFGRYFGRSVMGVRMCTPREYILSKLES